MCKDNKGIRATIQGLESLADMVLDRRLPVGGECVKALHLAIDELKDMAGTSMPHERHERAIALILEVQDRAKARSKGRDVEAMSTLTQAIRLIRLDQKQEILQCQEGLPGNEEVSHDDEAR